MHILDLGLKVVADGRLSNLDNIAHLRTWRVRPIQAVRLLHVLDELASWEVEVEKGKTCPLEQSLNLGD